MPVIGITGGVASGKSTFRKLLLDRIDADYFDADACARDLLDSDGEIREQVIDRLSPRAYNESGRPDRAHLRELVFRDIEKRKTLEAILHPVIRSRWTSEARKASRHARLFVVDIPLLFETRAETLFDHIIVVACAQKNQIDRLMQYRHMDADLARKVLASQWSMSLKMSRADHVIWNGSDLDLMESQADLLAAHLHRKYDRPH